MISTCSIAQWELYMNSQAVKVLTSFTASVLRVYML